MTSRLSQKHTQFTNKKPVQLAIAALLGGFDPLLQAQESNLPDVEVLEFRGEQMNSLKYSRPLQDTPRIITVLPKDLLEEQNVTTLNEALRNIPGISLQAGEGNPPGGDQFKIRGFNARDDINVNGMRDVGNYFRDPFYVDQLEVVKGPNSAFSGRGSAGGTVNFVTKKPSQREFSRVEFGLGTDQYRRLTLDANRPLDDNSAVRVNLMSHDTDRPGRDVAKDSRYGLYAAYTWGFTGSTRIEADFLHVNSADIPDAGLPFDRAFRNGQGTGRVPSGLNYNNFYGHTTDYKDVEVNQLGLSIQHSLASGLVIRNQTRLSTVSNDSLTSSPRFVRNDVVGNQVNGCQPGAVTNNNDPASGCAVGNLKPRDQDDTAYRNQTDFLFSFNTAGVQHDMVVGFDLAQYTYENRRRLDRDGPATSLFNPQARAFTGNLAYGGIHRLKVEEYGLYVLDTLKFSPKWELNAGVRYDNVEARADEFDRQNSDAPGLTAAQAENRHFARKDDEFSYSLGLVYKLNPRHSLYASTGTAFNISGNFDRNQVQLAGGSMNDRVASAFFNAPTEKIQAFELGSKMTVGTGLDINTAVFRTQTDEGRFPASDPSGVTVPNVEYFINGFEVLLAGQVTKAWRVYSGYTYLESEVTRAPNSPFAVGQRLGGTPEHSFNIFSTYDITPQITLGGGVQHVSNVTSGVQPFPQGSNALGTGNVKVEIPSYTVVDLYSTYKFNRKTQLRVNVFNLFDERYIAQLAEGGGQGIPGAGRQLIATVRHDF